MNKNCPSLCRNIFVCVVLFCILAFISFPVPAKNMTSYLNELNIKYNHKIAFSSNITNSITPTHQPTGSDLKQALKNLLSGTELEYKEIHGFFIIKRKKIVPKPKPVTPVVRKEKPKVVEKPIIDKYPSKYICKAWPVCPSVNSDAPETLPVILSDYIQPKDTIRVYKNAIKSNLLYDAVSTLNIGYEMAITNKITFELIANVNPWTFKNDKKWQLYALQAGIKYWFQGNFNKFFINTDLLGGYYNMSRIKFTLANSNVDLSNLEYRGTIIGWNVGTGFIIPLSERLKLEGAISVGYIRFHYDRYHKTTDSFYKINTTSKKYVGPTKISLSLMYLF